MDTSQRLRRATAFRPRSQALALEPRLLFDGAAASAADQQHTQAADNPAAPQAEVPHPATAVEARAPTPRPLVVIDARLQGYDQLAASLPTGTAAVVVQPGEDAVAVIAAALDRQGQVSSVQIFSHGGPGQFTLGDQRFDSAAVDALGERLAGWGEHLAAGADIQLYGCAVGAGTAGQALVQELARWTGADVGASSNATGSLGAGGDWALEVQQGVVDKSIALGADALSSYQGLLADAAPALSVSIRDSDVLIGDSFTFDLSLTNDSSQVGFAPYIDLFIPVTGKDGDDGISFVSASYLGQALPSFVVTFDAAGLATHPLAKGSDGNALVLNAASVGMQPGDQFVVLQVPYASLSQDQPALSIQVNAHLSNLADTSLSDGSPDLTLNARAGFQYGNDSLDNPATDPSLVEASLHALVIHPTLLDLTQSLDMTEGETATGPNFVHTQTVTITPAGGQTLTQVVMNQALPQEVQVTSIDPGTGGTLASVTLGDGTLLTNPAAISAAIASDALYITAYSISYASLSGPTQAAVQFYVPQVGADGEPVLDPTTGNPVTVSFAAPSANGQWTPLDPRDLVAPATAVDFSATGDGANAVFVAKAITLQKQATLETDLGSPGLSPGDLLRYSLSVALSDYFAFGSNLLEQGQLTLTDTLTDGQVLDGPLTMTLSQNGASQAIALVYSSVANADGTTAIVVDIGESIRAASSAIGLGALWGDLAFDDTQTAATTAVIGYTARVSQRYVTDYPPHSDINEGDSLGNDALVTATVLQDPVNIGADQTDDSSVALEVPTDQVNIELYEVNGTAPPSDGELRPGDVVTFELSYDLVTGDYENFSLTAYLPLPLAEITGSSWTRGIGVGQWTFGAGDTDPTRPVTVSSGPGNSIVFDFGEYSVDQTTGGRIEVRFTGRVSDRPFADQRALDVLAQSSQTTTIDKTPLISSDVAQIVSVAEPLLSIGHGVVSSSNGTVTGTSGSWALPGTQGVPFSGSVVDLAAIDGDVSGIDGADSLRLAAAIENTGGGGAFDVVTSVTLPAGLSFVGGSLAAANLQLYRGDGTQLQLGVDYSVSGSQISFLDAGATATLLPGRAGTLADSSGQNIVVITYDVTTEATIAAARTLQSSAVLTQYAGAEGGANFVPAGLTVTAAQQVAAPVITKVFAGGSLSEDDSSAAHTTGSNLVVGETMLYDMVITLPEGLTQNLRVDDLIPPGMQLNTAYNQGLGYELILTAAGSGGSLAQDFGGNVAVSGLAGSGGTLGADGVDGQWSFSASTASADNLTGNNSFVIRVQLVAANVIANQANRALQNNNQLLYQDPDGDTPNGAAALERTVARSGGAPTVTLREPTLQLTQTLDTAISYGGFDEGDEVEFSLTLSNGSGATDYAAFDISLLDTLPSQLDGLTLVDVTYQNGATANGGPGFVVQNGQLLTASGANIDIAKGGSIVIRLTGTVNATAAGQANFANPAQLQWTSLDGADSNERTGAQGALDGGSLNDYRRDSTLLFPVSNGILISHIGGMVDTPPPVGGNGTPDTAAIDQNVAVGEIIRYRTVVLVPTGDNPDYQVRLELDAGLSFIPADLNNILIALVSDSTNGLASDKTLTSAGTLRVLGDQTSAVAQSITPDLSGIEPTGVFDASAGNLSIVDNTDGSQTVTFNLGRLTNTEANDGNLEGVILDFNVRVTNVASNQAGAVLGIRAVEHVGTAGQDVDRGQSDSLLEHIVEPGFSAIEKAVVGIQPGAGETTATVSVTFTQNGGVPAYDVHLQDQFPGATGYTVTGLVLNGTALDLGNLPSGVSVSNSGAVAVDFQRLAVGDQVQVVYEVVLPSQAVVPDDSASAAVLTWTSLPGTFESSGWGGSLPGDAGLAGGERNGQDGASGLNNYLLADGAGLGVIQGTLWNDTATATANTSPDGTGLAGQAVQLTWAGADGVAGNADDRLFTATTDANGFYQFALLPSGNYLVAVPSSLQLAASDRYQVRIDTDTGTSATGLGSVVIALGEGAIGLGDAGYVHLNEAPVNGLPAQHGVEDTVLHLSGLTLADVDAGNGPLTVTLSVSHGVLWQSATAPAAGATPPAAASRALTLSGTLSQLTTALAQIYYKGDQDFNTARTPETLTMQSHDQGNFGDADGDGIPGENPADDLSDLDSVTILIDPVNDLPVATPDIANALEAGGSANQTPGSNPSGSVLANDTDVDIATDGDVLSVISAGVQGAAEQAVPAGGSAVVVGSYGTLVISAAGGSRYEVDNANAAVQALRLATDTLVETFTYSITDAAGATRQSTITVSLRGANDTPVATDDTGTALEAGGINNATPGQDATGNVLSNDTDVDRFGETRQVSGIRTLRESSSGTITEVTAAAPVTLAGQYGVLTIAADGSYAYAVDNTSTAVQRLGAGDSLTENFTYRVTDAGGLSDLAQLRITLNGANDNPVASDDQAVAQVASTNNNAQESNPTGNVILFPSRPGNVNQPGGNGVDNDVDRADRPNTLLQVTGIAAAPESASPGLVAVPGNTDASNGAVLEATYGEINGAQVTDPDPFGTLVIGADGSFTFNVNSDNATLQGLPQGSTLTAYFTYEVTDTASLTDRAQLVITVHGVNDPPVAQIIVATAIERGGVNNATAGTDPVGDVTQAAFDPDGDPISVIAAGLGAVPAQSVTGPTLIQGQYGTLTIAPDGTYTYALDNSLAIVEGLRTASDRLFERFTYTIADDQGEQSEPANLLVVIHGRDDNPVGVDDNATAVEAGGIGNNRPGTDPGGNVLDNDSDVDDALNGETTTVAGVRTGDEAAGGAILAPGTELRGTYGWLTLEADGSYRYRLDNADPSVQALRTAGDSLSDVFTYSLVDTDGAQDQAALVITIVGANDSPVAQNDAATAVEAGGTGNGTPGVDPTGNVLDNDSDVDFGDELSVTGLRQGLNAGTPGTAFQGRYGTLTLAADGSYRYAVDNANPLVQALRTSGETLQESFVYSLRDLAGASTTATLTISLQGQNDNPVAADDSALAIERGGTANGSGGVNPTGNLLANDTDVDSGDSRQVDGVRLGAEAAGGDFTNLGAVQTLVGEYGSLTLGRNGAYSYAVNNQDPRVEALKAGESLTERFTYRMQDAAGASDIAQLTITLRGSYDAPVGVDDLATAVASVQNGATGFDPSGNALNNDTDVDANDSQAVSAIRAGQEASGGALAGVTAGTDSSNGTLLDGAYGQLIIGADGSFHYQLDNSNAAVLALLPLQTLSDYFTYQVQDAGGLVDEAQIRILVIGRNNAPTANPDAGVALEAGGLNNDQPGSDPSGNLLGNDTDLENDALQVSQISIGNDAGAAPLGSLGVPLTTAYGTLLVEADGRWSYQLDNQNPAVEALRTGGQVLTEVFSYQIVDRWGAQSSSQLLILIRGSNDTPIAQDDSAEALEAGGIANATPGLDPSGNVLGNDSDVDSQANGESQAVIQYSTQTGQTSAAGEVLQGRYGSLLIAADGTYRYTVDNADPSVQALRTAQERLRDVFTYRMRDAAGAISEARLTVTLHGANDNPIARDDASFATDQIPAPHSLGNVLPNDSDVDGQDAIQVSGVRAGEEGQGGAFLTTGTPVAGLYGTLVLGADGSYRYTIDLNNPAVLAAAGLGQVLKDPFTYSISDLTGATDQAQLTITLDIATPYVPPPGPQLERGQAGTRPYAALPSVTPVVYVAPEVRLIDHALALSAWDTNGNDLLLFAPAEIESRIGAQLGHIADQFVGQAVAESQMFSQLDTGWVQGRQGVVGLSADGLLSDPSVWATAPADMVQPEAKPARAAPGFSAQLREAAQRRGAGN